MNTFETAHARLIDAGLPPGTIAKFEALVRDIQAVPGVAVAFSGGVDSSFLAYAAHLALGQNMVAVTIHSPAEPPEQVERAAQFAAEHGFRHVVMTYDLLSYSDYRRNPVDRCYHCKTVILNMIWKFAREQGLPVVYEGQNADDQGDYRPGRKAVSETGTHSPLAEHGLTKAEIRALAKALGLSVWDQPSSPCLASRFPYGTAITAEGLRQIALGEAYLHQHGFPVSRVRYHNELARIEVAPDQISQLVGLRDDLVRYFKAIGFRYVSLDLQGYRQGSLNEGLGL